MKLNFLEIENIRSYHRTKVDFGDGVTLFEGDVGSGKSTLLYAIEFALFGLGDLKPGHLLRHGTARGSVRLGIDVEGKNVVIHRGLERQRDSARQTPGWIEEDDLRTEYSPEEMKQRVIQLLKFRENPAAKATSWIFRYAVFTPQEQMKEILSLKPEERLQTLRKAFGVEEYRIAQEHASWLQRALREQSREWEGELKDFGELLKKEEELEKKLEDAVKKSLEQEKLVVQVEKTANEAEGKVKAARDVEAKLDKIGAELPLLQRRQEELKQEVGRADNELQSAKKKSGQLQEEKERLHHRIQLTTPNAHEAWEHAEARVRQLEAILGEAKHRAEEHAALRSGVCPTCRQKIPKDFTERIQVAEEEFERVKTELRTAIEQEQEARKKAEAAREQRFLQERLADVEEQLAMWTTKTSELEPLKKHKLLELASVESEWAKKSELFSHWRRAREEREAAEQVWREVQKILQQALQGLASLQTQAKQLQTFLEETKAHIEKKSSLREKLSELKEKETWLEEHFAPSIDSIEQHVLQRINDEFNILFAKWFIQLLETQDLEAEADVSFTPVIRQQGYEQDYTALSGGEKSALALAYRLSLNTLVRQTTPSLKNNLLILDEPTDGFSKEQLGRMRSVLNEVGAQQILLVSHERELEAFCDRVFSVEKQHGESRIKEL